MQNTNQRITRRTSPGRDPVVLAMKAAAAILALAAVALIVHLASRGPHIQCPPQDHPVWAQVLDRGRGEWICGDSLTAGVTAR